jgi:hypothetical protein
MTRFSAPVIAEFRDKQPLPLQINAEVIDAAANLTQRHLRLEYERWARRLRTGCGGPDYARGQKVAHPSTLSSS